MRIEALETSLGSDIAVNMISAAQYWWQKGMDEHLEMGVTGRSFPIETLSSNHRMQAATRIYRPGRSARRAAPYLSYTGMVDLRAIIKLLKVSENKIRILKLLRRRDWIKILRLLPKDLLINALRLFSKEKLLRLMLYLPKQLLLKVILKLFKIHALIKKMPTTELMRILRSHKLNNRELAKGLMKAEPKFILLLLQRIYGHYDYSKLKPYDLFRIFMHTPKERLMQAFKTMSFKFLQPFITEFVKKDPELLLNLSDYFIFKLLEKTPKSTLIQGCTVLPPEILIKMLCQLQDPLLIMAASQVDDATFENYLINQHPDLLKILAGAA